MKTDIYIYICFVVSRSVLLRMRYFRQELQKNQNNQNKYFMFSSFFFHFSKIVPFMR